MRGARAAACSTSCQLWPSAARSVLAFLARAAATARRSSTCSSARRGALPRRPVRRGGHPAATATDLRADIRSHGWGFPVGYDRDGAVANLYGVAVCPTITFAYPGGTAMTTTLGLLDARDARRDRGRARRRLRAARLEAAGA